MRQNALFLKHISVFRGVLFMLILYLTSYSRILDRLKQVNWTFYRGPLRWCLMSSPSMQDFRPEMGRRTNNFAEPHLIPLNTGKR